MSEVAFEREVLDRLTKIEAKLDSFDAAKKRHTTMKTTLSA